VPARAPGARGEKQRAVRGRRARPQWCFRRAGRLRVGPDLAGGGRVWQEGGQPMRRCVGDMQQLGAGGGRGAAGGRGAVRGQRGGPRRCLRRVRRTRTGRGRLTSVCHGLCRAGRRGVMPTPSSCRSGRRRARGVWGARRRGQGGGVPKPPFAPVDRAGRRAGHSSSPAALSLVCAAQHATAKWALRAAGQREGRTPVGGEQMVHAERVVHLGSRNEGRGRGELEGRRLGGHPSKAARAWAGVNTAELFYLETLPDEPCFCLDCKEVLRPS
jgi:hypothetical protein